MTGYVRPLAIEPGMFKSERFVTIRTVNGEVEHLVDERSLESGLLLVRVVTWAEPRKDAYLVRFPYSCEPLTCWIAKEDLILPTEGK